MAKRKPKVSDAAAKRSYNKIKAMPAAIDELQMQIIEQVFDDPDNGLTRRAALAVLVRPASVFFESIEKDRTAAVALAQVMLLNQSYAKHLNSMSELVTAAASRIMTALCIREDMDDVLRDAKAAIEGNDEGTTGNV